MQWQNDTERRSHGFCILRPRQSEGTFTNHCKKSSKQQHVESHVANNTGSRGQGCAHAETSTKDFVYTTRLESLLDAAKSRGAFRLVLLLLVMVPLALSLALVLDLVGVDVSAPGRLIFVVDISPS
jgi:hypothetical protein